MTETKPGPLPGYRPSGSSLNGMPPGGGYRYRKFEAWYPEAGVHLDPEGVAPDPASAKKWHGGRAARFAVYSEARRSGLTRAEAAARVGIAAETSARYERDYRKAAGS